MSHLKDFEVVLRFFYQVSDGKVHPLSVPAQRQKKASDQLQNSAAAARRVSESAERCSIEVSSEEQNHCKG